MTIDTRAAQGDVLYQRDGGIARIQLNRPERGNSLAPAMQETFRAIWAEVRDDDAVRVAIFSAAGERHFCTGFDVSQAAGDDAGDVFDNRPLAEAVHWSPHQNRVWKPVICVVNGLCVGGGLHFVVDADIVVASENAAFMDTHVNVGMVGALENVGLARRLPLGAALRMTLLGRHYRMPARRAYELGLVDELVATRAEALACAEEMAAAVLENSPQAVSLSKQAVWGSLERSYGDALEYAWSLSRLHWAHPDFVEGPRAFSEKRAPRWNADPNARDNDSPSARDNDSPSARDNDTPTAESGEVSKRERSK